MILWDEILLFLARECVKVDRSLDRGEDIEETINKIKSLKNREKKKNIDDNVSANDFFISEKLRNKILEYRPNHKMFSVLSGAKIIKSMFNNDKRLYGDMLDMVNWYPIGQKYIPEIFSAQSFREKYDKLVSAKMRFESTTIKNTCTENIFYCPE